MLVHPFADFESTLFVLSLTQLTPQTQYPQAITASLDKNAKASAALSESETANSAVVQAQIAAGVTVGGNNNTQGTNACKAKAQSFDIEIQSTKTAAAKAQMASDQAKARADAAAKELMGLMRAAETAADMTSTESSMQGKAGRLARARNATAHAKAVNEEARALRETSLQRADEAADLIVHLNRLQSDKAAAVLATCGKKQEYMAKVDEVLESTAEDHSPPEATEVSLLLEEELKERVEAEGATLGSTGATGTKGGTGLTGATGLGRDGIRSLEMLANIPEKAGMTTPHLGDTVTAAWAAALLKANELRPGATGATGATGMADGKRTWAFGGEAIDTAFGPTVRDAEGNDAHVRLEEAGGRYQPSPSVHKSLNADVAAEVERERKAADMESKRRATPPILGFEGLSD